MASIFFGKPGSKPSVSTAQSGGKPKPSTLITKPGQKQSPCIPCGRK